MSEIRTVKLLRTLLAAHLDWHGSRLDFLARFILAVLQVRSVHLARLAPVFSSRAKTNSNDIRLQRFMRAFTIDQADIARTVGDLLPNPCKPVAFLLADREFVGREWLRYLLQRE